MEIIKINNSKKSAIKTGGWSNPGARFYDRLLDSFYCEGNVPTDSKELDKKIKEGKYLEWYNFLKEAYLIAPVSKIKNSPYGRTPFSRSGCQYPHHQFKGKELVVSIPGLKAAYTRACQMNILKGDVKEHLERHIKELGIEASFHDGKLSWNESSLYNEDEEYFDEKSHGLLKYEFRFVIGEDDGHLYKIIYELNPKNIVSNNIDTGKGRDELETSIRKTGNSNYVSKNNKILGIVDLCNNKKVNEINGYPPIHNIGGTISPKTISGYMNIMKCFIDNKDELEKIEEKLKKEYPTGIVPNPGFKFAIKKSKEKGQNPIKYTVGTIDNTETYKTTNPEKVMKGMLGLYNEDEEYFDEKSHGSLKYEYRIGVDVKTGKLTAIQFKLDPSKIISVGNKTSYDTSYLLTHPDKLEKVSKIEDLIDELEKQGKSKEAAEYRKKLDDKLDVLTADTKNNALDFMKKNIKKLGHIDYVSDESIVDKIFYKDEESIQSVEIIPTLSNTMYSFLSYLEDNYEIDDFLVRSPYSYGRGSENYSFSYKLLFSNDSIRKIFIDYCKKNNIHGEKYEVGKSAGKNKYRSTKILWDNMWLYKKFTKSPVLRGNLNPYSINNNFDTYNGLNKPKTHKFNESYRCIESNFNDIYSYIMENTGINLFNDYDEFTENTTALEGPNDTVLSTKVFFDECERTPEGLLKWMNENISYDKTIRGWKLRTPVEIYKDGKGNCHDQSLFISSLLHSMGIINGQIFFVECAMSADNPDGNAHTLTWYKIRSNNKEGWEYYWIETAWEKYKGIHGPYASISELKNAVIDAYNNDDDINSHNPNYQTLAMGVDSSNYLPGMSLAKYIMSWKIKEVQIGNYGIIRPVKKSDLSNGYFLNWLYKLDQFKNKDPKDFNFDLVTDHSSTNFHVYGYFVNNNIEGIIRCTKNKKDDNQYIISFFFVNKKYHDKGFGSALMHYVLNKFNDKELLLYAFEFNKKAINIYKHYGFNIINTEKALEYPKDDPMYGKKFHTMIKLPEEKETIESYMDWIDNFVHNDLFQEKVTMEYSFKKVKTPEELLKWMDNISYGWLSNEDNKPHVDNNESDEEFEKIYKLQSPSQVIKNCVGTCYDQCELERKWFYNKGISFTILYIEISNERKPTHTFCIYETENGYNWFEHSWESYKGIHKYEKLKDLIYDIINKFKSFNNDYESPIILTNLSSKPKYGIGSNEFMDYAHSQHSIDLNDLSNEIFNESINETIELGRLLTSEDLKKYRISDEELKEVRNRDILNDSKSVKESIMYECGIQHGTGIDGDDLGWIEKYLIEEGETMEEPPSMDDNKKQSMPKQVDAAESNKNGVRRKKLYIAFIEWAKEFNNKNTFGSIFDKDAFKVTYPFIPNEMRYFYRLANPLLCVLSGDLTFFQASELRKLNAKNTKLNEMMIFAATPNDMRIFNIKDKKVYRGEEENGSLVLKEILSDTFDNYIQKMINKGDILNGPIEDNDTPV